MPWLDPEECDCMDAEIDILTGIERCDACGSSRWLDEAEFTKRLRQEAEWQAEYDHHCCQVEQQQDTALPAIGLLAIKCPRCGRTTQSARDELDPPEAAIAMILCPDCVGGDFGETTYLDASGRELMCGPEGYYLAPIVDR